VEQITADVQVRQIVAGQASAAGNDKTEWPSVVDAVADFDQRLAEVPVSTSWSQEELDLRRAMGVSVDG
jgi:hypothetical protein